IQFTIKYAAEVRRSASKRYDLIYPMSLSIARRLNKKGIPLKKMATGITSLRVFENEMTSQGQFKPEFIQFVKKLRGINAWSNEIVRIFRPHCKIYKTRIGIDEELFRPSGRRTSSSTFR